MPENTRESNATTRGSASGKKRPNQTSLKLENTTKGRRLRTRPGFVEPYLSDQWFVKMEALAKPAIEAVRNGRVTFPPSVGRTSTTIGSRTSATGAFPGSSGGDTGSRSITATCGEIIASMDVSPRAQVRPVKMRRTRTCSTPGSARSCGRFPRSAGPKDAGARVFLSDQRALDRPGHPLPLGRADDHERYYFKTERFRSMTSFSTPRLPRRGKEDEQVPGSGVDPLDLIKHFGADGLRFGDCPSSRAIRTSIR